MPPAVLMLAVFLAGCAPKPMLPETGLVDVASLEPGIVVDIRYATDANFLKRAVYTSKRCWLVRETAERLVRAHRELKKQALGLKVWDCYRPRSIQRQMWTLKPDPVYVAPPERGSHHSRGAAVDVTLVDSSGRELEMPTRYDDFSQRAHRDWRGASPKARQNLAVLEAAMRGQGFIGLPQEWWHFDDPNWKSYPLLDVSPP
jgi:D-alanyl-D-alanine dipeptidase